MTPADLIGDVHQHGGDMTVDGDDLTRSAPQPLPAELVDQVRTHELELLQYLNNDAANTDADASASGESHPLGRMGQGVNASRPCSSSLTLGSACLLLPT